MLNLAYLIRLHFQPTKDWLADERVRSLLDRDLDLAPEELAIHIYRVQRAILDWFDERQAQPLLKMLWYLQRMYTQIEIYYTASIGSDFRIIHGLGTVIGARVRIGNHVTVYQGVTVGSREHGVKERPVIGDYSVLYAGSRVLGAVTLGQHCIVGANALVLDSFPDYAVVRGTPAKLVRYQQLA